MAAHNSTYPKFAVHWLNEALCFEIDNFLISQNVIDNVITKVITFKNNGKMNRQRHSDRPYLPHCTQRQPFVDFPFTFVNLKICKPQ